METDGSDGDRRSCLEKNPSRYMTWISQTSAWRFCVHDTSRISVCPLYCCMVQHCFFNSSIPLKFQSKSRSQLRAEEAVGRPTPRRNRRASSPTERVRIFISGKASNEYVSDWTQSIDVLRKCARPFPNTTLTSLLSNLAMQTSSLILALALGSASAFVAPHSVGPPTKLTTLPCPKD